MPPPSAGSAAAVLARPSTPTPAEAEALCARIARRHYENFPVGSWLLPAAVRPAVRAVYAFARAADDYADEPEFEGRRLTLRDAWQRSLDAAFEGEAHDPVFVALAAAVRRHELPKQPFLDLLAAFRRDATTPRTPDWATLLDYCRLSANPIGRIVLHLFDCADEGRLRLSDRICTGLQLANHWQDLAIDARRGRFYAPTEMMLRHDVEESALAAGEGSDAGRALVRDLVARSVPFFDEGRDLCDRVPGRLRYELRLTWLGGRGILDAVEASGGDVWRRRPRIGAVAAARLAWGALLWRR